MNHIAIVTGGAQGIGKAICESLAAHGVAVAVADINTAHAAETAESLNAQGYKAMAVTVDVASVASIEAMVEKVVETFGGVDILVNNAGILHSTALEDITEAEWDRMMAVNLKGVFFASQKVLPHMKAKGWGRIINMSSLAGRMGGYQNGLAYSASKAAIVGLTQGMARRIAETGVTVNAIAPGTTESEIIKAFTPEKIAELQSIIPMKRLGKPRDIAAVASFLASEEAGFITGAVIDINGGMFTGG